VQKHHLQRMVSLFTEWQAKDTHVRTVLEMMHLGLHGCTDSPPAPWFSFGDVSNNLFRERNLKCVQMMGKGLLKFPYPNTIFTHTLTSSDDHQYFLQSFYVVLDHNLRWASEEGPGLVVNKFTIAEMRLEDTASSLGVLLTCRLCVTTDYMPAPSGEHYTVSVNANPMRLDGSDLKLEINSAADPVAVMNVILNTKNIPKTHVDVPPKLAAARKKNGKPPLHPYTYVNAGMYERALRETTRMEKAGHRASPCMHLRRGHIRTYKASKLEVWINDMIINAEKDAVLSRKPYEVR
jgi:hypothetical protein